MIGTTLDWLEGKGREMPRKTFRFTLVVPDAKNAGHAFDEKMGPGVLANQDVSYDLPDDFSELRLAHTIMNESDRFRDSMIEIQVEEVTEES